MYRSNLEKLWFKRAVIEACVKVANEYEARRQEAEQFASSVEWDCHNGTESYHEHVDGEDPADAADREYESHWDRVVSQEDRASDAASRPECGSIREILHLADSLAQAILAASKSGCESKVYGIHRIDVD